MAIKHMAVRYKKPNFARYFISDEDREIILKFHSYPFLWWIGQTFKFIFRLQPPFEYEFTGFKERLDIKRPIVGYEKL